MAIVTAIVAARRERVVAVLLARPHLFSGRLFIGRSRARAVSARYRSRRYSLGGPGHGLGVKGNYIFAVASLVPDRAYICP